MIGSLNIELGWCGFGASRGLFPEIRLGLVRLWCCRGSVFDHYAYLRSSLETARCELRRALGR
jgi:hypothetical protein